MSIRYAALVAALLAALATPVGAQTTAQSDTVIQACYTRASGVLYILDEGDVGCRRENDIRVQWNGFIDLTLLQQRVAAGCVEQGRVRAVRADGSVECETDDDAAAAVDFSSLQRRLTSECPVGSVLRGVTADGQPECAPDTVPQLAGLQVRIAYACPDGSAIQSIDEAGNVDCRIDDFRGFTPGPTASVSMGDAEDSRQVVFGSPERQACFLSEVEIEDIDANHTFFDVHVETASCLISNDAAGWHLTATISGVEDPDANVWCSASCVSW